MTTTGRPQDHTPAGTPDDIPITCRILALVQERDRLFACPPEVLVGRIRDTGFRCTRCGSCCTRTVNSHVFLLDHDVARARKIDPQAIVPAPDPEFCDQEGSLYVSGYALRARDDGRGSCWFLDSTRCTVYPDRFAICRIYPFMLRRTKETNGEVVWQVFARKNRHGAYDNPPLSSETCHAIAREVREYENAFLTQQIAFLEKVREHFLLHGLRHDPELLLRQARLFADNAPVKVMVFHAGELEQNILPFPGIGQDGNTARPTS